MIEPTNHSHLPAVLCLATLLSCGVERERDEPGGWVSSIGSASATATEGESNGGSGGEQTGPGTTTLDPSGGTDGLPTGDDCAEVSETATVGPQPADIIFVIDNSGSMDAEASFVQQHMNAFSAQIVAADIDVHVVVISAYPGESDAGVCIDPPLGGGGCPAADDNPPSFLHIPSGVGSNNALQKLLEHYPDYASVLRPTASKHVVVVSDDDSDIGSADFMQQLATLAPELLDFTFHGIVAEEDPVGACFNSTSCCLTSAAEGKVYKELIDTTGGVYGNLCDQEFQPIFDEVATVVIGGATLACEYDIPDPPEGETFDPDKVNVSFDDGQGGTLDIGRVEDPSECAGVTHGWYYDDPAAPTTIVVCPQTCETIQGFDAASIAIAFGCATIPAG